MTIYVDNNILIDFENGTIDLPLDESHTYYYSSTHIEELLESNCNLKERASRRLATISKLTGDKILANNDFWKICESVLPPGNALEATMVPELMAVNKLLHSLQSQWKSEEYSEKLMRDLHIEKKVINNLNWKGLVTEYGSQILSYIQRTCGGNVMAAYQSCFNILDMLGYWMDVPNEGSNMNRCYDAKHAYFASYCDIFLTNDKKTMNKANVAYGLFEAKTKAMSFREFLK